MLTVCDNDQNSLNDGSFLRSSFFFFAQFITMPKKQILARVILESKRKLGVTTHISEIIKPQ